MELLRAYTASVVLIMLCIIPRNELTRVKPEDLFKDDEVKTKYGKLLTAIANVNKQRIDALAKYNALDNYNVATGILRNVEDEQENRNISRSLFSLYDYDIERSNDGLLHTLNPNAENAVRKAPIDTIDPKLRTLLSEFSDNDITDDLINDELRKKLNMLYEYGNITNTEDDEHEGDDEDDEEDDNEVTDGLEVEMIADNRNDAGEEGDDAMRHNHKKGKSCPDGECHCLRACQCAYRSFCNQFYCCDKTKKMMCVNCRLQCSSSFR